MYDVMKIKGIVIDGKNQSKKLGFPTINLVIRDEDAISLSAGVYGGKVFFENCDKKAAIFIEPKKRLLEAHLLDFSGNLRGKEVEVRIGKKIRDVIIFSNNKNLSAQIAKDIKEIIKF
jgi:riboflavin kinase/FMN adenylyltransferase